MIGFLLGLGVLAGFAAVNTEHRSDVSFGFFSFQQVPVFLSLLVAFIAGALFVLPLALRRGRRMRDAELANAATEGQVRAAVAARARRRRDRGKDAVESLPAPAGEAADEEAGGEGPLGLASPEGSAAPSASAGTRKTRPRRTPAKGAARKGGRGARGGSRGAS